MSMLNYLFWICKLKTGDKKVLTKIAYCLNNSILKNER